MILHGTEPSCHRAMHHNLIKSLRWSEILTCPAKIIITGMFSRSFSSRISSIAARRVRLKLNSETGKLSMAPTVRCLLNMRPLN